MGMRLTRQRSVRGWDSQPPRVRASHKGTPQGHSTLVFPACPSPAPFCR